VKPFSRLGEDVLKPGCPITSLDQTTRFGHAVIHPQLFLPPVLQEISDRHAACGRVRQRKRLITLRADAGGNFHGGAIAEPALFGPKSEPARLHALMAA
jgi:hypothetical protein